MINRSGPVPVLAAHDIHKQYASGTVALRGVDLAVMPGSVHALVGANGAGKSTLIKILSGVEQPTAGRVTWRSEDVEWTNPSEALAVGLAAVHQHTPLAMTMSVLDNVFLGQGKSLRWDVARRRAELVELFNRINYRLDPDKPVSDLSVGSRQMVAILQALVRRPDLILLDEPTASLSSTERQVLFDVIHTLRSQGTSFVYISHFLDEVMAMSDQMTVLRDGRVVMDLPTADATKDSLIVALVGDRLHQVEVETTAVETRSTGKPLLEVKGLESAGVFGPIDLTVHAGEVVGLAGLLGSGRSEILHAIFGADHSVGTVSLDGKILRRRSPRRSVRAGMALVPEDRVRQGFIAGWEIWRNASLPYLPMWSRRRILPRQSEERSIAQQSVTRLGIKTASVDTPVGELSGGNAQKVVIAKWLHGPARMFLLDEPGAGVDVGAKADIIQVIRDLADRGHGVLVVDSEFAELLAACDRVLVLRRGQIVEECFAATHDEHHLTSTASGLQ